MKRAVPLFLLSILICLAASSPAAAKSPPDKITITGPGLAKSIVITDPKILEPFSPWDDAFFDGQKGALAAAPTTDRLYDVTLYTQENDGQDQARYIFRYAPGQPGYIYIPGSGDPGYTIDIGTIMRGSTIEGHWFYASQEWSDLIQPLMGSQILSAKPSPLRSGYALTLSRIVLPILGALVVLAGALAWLYLHARTGTA